MNNVLAVSSFFIEARDSLSRLQFQVKRFFFLMLYISITFSVLFRVCSYKMQVFDQQYF